MKKFIIFLFLFNTYSFARIQHIHQQLKGLFNLDRQRYFPHVISQSNNIADFIDYWNRSYAKQTLAVRSTVLKSIRKNPHSINEKYSNGITDATPLTIASGLTQDRGETVNFLIHHEADPNPKLMTESLPLIQASKGKIKPSNPETIAVLLQAGADPFKKDAKQQISPFEYALRHADVIALRAYLYKPLVRQKINNSEFVLYESQTEKQTALRSLLSEEFTARLDSEELRASIALLQENGANIHEINSKGDTLLHTAIEYEHVEQTIKYLAQSGISIHTQNKKGLTALHSAADKKQLSVVDNNIEILLKLGANPNALDNTGETPLFKFFRNAEFDVNNLKRIIPLWNATNKSKVNNQGETVVDVIRQRYLALCKECELPLNPKTLFKEFIKNAGPIDVNSCFISAHEQIYERRCTMILRTDNIDNDPYSKFEELICFLHKNNVLDAMPEWPIQ